MKNTSSISDKPPQPDFYQGVDRLLIPLIDQQRAKVLEIARKLRPGTTLEDILNPQTFPELIGDVSFNYEDGILTGLLSAQTALRAEIRRLDTSQQPLDWNSIKV